MVSFHLRSDQRHLAWDNTLAPAVVIAPGDEITLELGDSSGGQIGERDDASALGRFDLRLVNPCTGPVFVDGLGAGDELVVTILGLETRSWAWTANIPGFGLLGDDFPDAHLWISPVHDGVVSLPIGIDLAAQPMIGTIGVAPAALGRFPLLVPTEAGGNMDIAQIGAGAVLHLPTQVDGGLLSAGDAHAVQGDGEVCGTGAETSATVTLRVDAVRSDHGGPADPPASPWFEHSGRRLETASALSLPATTSTVATTGIGPELFQAARDATRRAIDLVSARSGLDPIDAYLLLSLAGQLRISEIVDVPNFVVTMHVPTAYVNGTG